MSGCEEEWCTHCLFDNFLYTNSAGQRVTVIDQHPVNTSASYYNRSQCRFYLGNQYNNNAVFFTLDVGANITFQNMEIDNIRVRAQMLILANGNNYIGFLNTTIARMDFTKTLIGQSANTAASIMVEFDSAYVTGFNRDHSFTQSMGNDAGLLIFMSWPGTVYIRNTVFESNFISGVYTFTMFINAQVTHFEIVSSAFRMCMGGVHFGLYDSSSPDFSLMSNVTFETNYYDLSYIFSVLQFGGIRSLVLENMAVVNSVGRYQGILYFSTTGQDFTTLNLTMVNVNVTNNRITYNANGGIVTFKYVTIVQIQGLRVYENLVLDSSFENNIFTYMLKNGLINDSPALQGYAKSTGVSSPYQVSFFSSKFLTITQFQMYTSKFASSNGVIISIEKDLTSAINITDSSFSSFGSSELVVTTTTRTNTMPVVVIRNCDFLGPNVGGMYITYTIDSGGGIIVSDSRFLNNGNATKYSSAISQYGWFMNISNCVFDGNQGSKGSGVYFWFQGNSTPVLDVYSRAVFITDCQFRNGFATFYGGDIFMENGLNSFPLLLYIGNTTLINSTAGSNSGSIKLSTITFSSILIENCLFSSSTKSQGGMVVLSYTTGALVIRNSSFVDISTTFGYLLHLSNLRIALTQDTSITLSNVTIRRCDFYVGIYFNLFPEMTVSTISNRYDSNHGNVILNNQGSFRDSGSVFYNNSFEYSPCYYQAGLTVARFLDTVFERNSATDTIGAVMISSESIATFRNCRFESNSAGNLTGAMQIEMGSAVVISGCEFLHNSASFAATLYLLEINSTAPLYIYDSVFIGNMGEGLLQMVGSNMYARNLTIKENQSKTVAGIMMIQSNLSLVNSVVARVTGTIGCLIYGVMGSGVLITGSTVSDITCEQESLLLFSNLNSSLNITESSLIRMSSTTSSVIRVGNAGLLWLDSVRIADIQSPLAVFTLRGISVSAVNSFVSAVNAVVFLVQEGSLQIKNSTFLGVTALTEVGGVNCVNCLSVSLDALTFTNVSSIGAAGVNITGSKNTVSVTRCRFEGLEGGTHGALAVDSGSLNITNSWFIDNKATGAQSQGGAVFTNVTSSVLSGNVFSGNVATNGGALSWTAAQPELQSNAFEGNTAVYGNDYASYPIELSLVNDSVSVAVSGQVFTEVIYVRLLDHYGQVVQTDNSSIAWISSASEITGNLKGSANEGIFSFSQFTVTHTPDSSVNVTVFASDLTLTFPIYLRNCVRGEIISNGACVPCQSGTYSLALAATACSPCLLNADCPGSNGLYPRPGFWRPDELYNGTIECPLAAACLGSANQTNSTGVCADGYTGNMCQSCATNHTRDGKDLCSPYLSEESRIILFTFLGVGICVFLVIVVMSSQASARNPANLSGVLFKIFLNYLHFTVLVGHFEMLWPKELKGLFNLYQYLGNSGEQFMMWGRAEKQPFYTEIVIVAALPAALILVNMTIWVLVKYLLRYTLRCLMCVLMISLIFIHPVVVRVAFTAFRCIDIKPEESWLRFEMDISCWDSSHSRYALAAALPVLILWGFGLPLVTFLFLIKYRKRLNEAEMKESLGFLWVGCKPALFYWELVKIVWKMFIIVLYVFLSYQTVALQALALCILLWVSAVLQSKYQAFQRTAVNKAELQSIWVSVVTAYSGVWYSSQTLSNTTEMVLYALILFAHMYFIIHWTVLMARTLLTALKKTHPNCMKWLPPRFQQYTTMKSAILPPTLSRPHDRTRGTSALAPSN